MSIIRVFLVNGKVSVFLLEDGCEVWEDYFAFHVRPRQVKE